MEKQKVREFEFSESSEGDLSVSHSWANEEEL